MESRSESGSVGGFFRTIFFIICLMIMVVVTGYKEALKLYPGVMWPLTILSIFGFLFWQSILFAYSFNTPVTRFGYRAFGVCGIIAPAILLVISVFTTLSRLDRETWPDEDTITAEKAKEMIDNNAGNMLYAKNHSGFDFRQVIVVDARKYSFQYSDGHIPGSVYLDEGDLPTFDENFNKKLQGSIMIIYGEDCSDDHQNKVAKSFLEDNDRLMIHKILVIQDGISAWKKNRYPIEMKSNGERKGLRIYN